MWAGRWRSAGPSAPPVTGDTVVDVSASDSRDWVAGLRTRFLALGGGEGEFAELLVRYEEPGRHYHTIGHIRDVTAAIDAWYPDSPDWLVLAAFYHDVIYDPTRHDNEVASAQFAVAQIGDVLGAHGDDLVRAIEMTAGHNPTTLDERDAALLVGDLIGMACSVERYRENTRLIRTEYAAFSDEEWARGRRSFIEKFDARRILPDERRFDEAELLIHANMRDELSRLGN
jgi:predicted metal-dependent HD superfamily phosphohydrolase